MRRVVFILPDLLAASGPSIARQELPALAYMAERAAMWRLTGCEGGGTPELAWFGLPPESRSIAQGPLTVAALGADPPSGSVHFHVSLLSCDPAGRVAALGRPPSDAGTRTIVEAAHRLNTRRLTFVAGEAADHGLVWENGSLDLGVVPAAEALGRAVAEALPEGDGERPLRQWIDDSVNLLSELPLNHERREEGLPPANLLWPWAPGMREPLPNLALHRGEPAWYVTRSMRARGLARLLGYRHGDPELLGNGFNFSVRTLTEELLARPPSVAVLDSFERARAAGRIDEASWLLDELDREGFATVLDRIETERVRLTLLAPDAEGGLGLEYDSAVPAQNAIPFDERALDDARLSQTTLFESVAEGLR
jgi:2,3-bisphosphoglycerate-independent phosphoglycerate mutase